MDALAEVLRVIRVRGAVLAQVLADDPWGIDIAGTAGAALHAVTAGVAWLRLPGRRARQLMPGDIVLLPSGARHAIASSPTVGQAPPTYLTRWRMDLAAQALRDTDRPVDAVGRDVRYTSGFAFNRAFSRAYGTPPGRYRHAVRDAQRDAVLPA